MLITDSFLLLLCLWLSVSFSFLHLLTPHLSFSAGDSVCWSPSITTCTECLSRGPQCAWCFKEVGMCMKSVRLRVTERAREREGEEKKKKRTWQTLSSIPQMTHTKALIPPTDVNIMCMFELSGLPYDLYECICVSVCVCVNVSMRAFSCGRRDRDTLCPCV